MFPQYDIVFWEFTDTQKNALITFAADYGVTLTNDSFRPYNGKFYIEQNAANIALLDGILLDFDDFDDEPGGDPYGYGTQSWTSSLVPNSLWP